MDDLKDLKIGITLGYEYSEEFTKAMNEQIIKTETVSRDELNYRKLLGKRIDIFPNDPTVGYAQLRSIFPPEKVKLFTHHPTPLVSTSLNLIISKKCKDAKWYIEKFNSGLKKLDRSGKLQQMKADALTGKYDATITEK